MYSRWQQKRVVQGLKTRRVLLLNGSRQCGKTTLAKELATEGTAYRTLDDLALCNMAQSDPQGFVTHPGNLLIIDEIQRAPSLLSAIKLVVDANTEPGQYLLTGSADIQGLPSVQESLAGRIGKIRLRPLSQGELLGTQPLFLDNAFAQSFTTDASTWDRKTMLEIAFRGGFPEPIKLDPGDRGLWYRDYVTALLEHDLREITHIVRRHEMEALVKILAAWSGKFMDISAIGSGLSIQRPTIESYISALETLYLIERVQPWTRTDYERVGKRSKLYMTDPGLMAAILRWNFAEVEFNSDRSGKLIETFIFNELAANIDVYQGKYTLYQYRDREQREIDFLIERDDHALLGIEVKAGSAISAADFKHLKWFQDTLAKNRPFVGIVLYSGDVVGSMGDNLWAVPFGALWAR